MKTTVSLLAGLGLLTACGPAVPTPAPTPPATSLPPARDAIPAVPRVVGTTFNCSSGAGPISGELPRNPRDTANVVSRFQAQATADTVWDLLYVTKLRLNKYYFGYSDVDLNTLHQDAYRNFKKTFPNALSTYPVTAEVDSLMNRYVAPLQVKDQHTYYLNAADVASLEAVKNNSTPPTPVFGLSFAAVPGGDGLVITDVRGDGPAFAAGLRRGDVLTSLSGQPLKRTVAATATDDTKQRSIYTKLLGDAAAPQTPVTFGVRRGTLTRPVTMSGTKLGAARLPWQETVQDAGGGRYMYLRLPTFEADGAGARVHELVARASEQGLAGVVVDLRNNGGGLLTEFVSAAAAFVPGIAGGSVKFADGSSASFRYSSGAVMRESSCKAPQTALNVPAPAVWNGKVAVLINAGSASGSEMFSANVRQGGQARLIGEETYGVGNTSTYLFGLPGHLGLSVTSGRVFVGGRQASPTVQPDLPVSDDLATLAAQGVDTALQTALAELAR